jgi:tetratricopeptide (TPR) repeat protein
MITDTLALALDYHERGETALAEQTSLSVLAQAPNHAGAFHLLGLIARKQGDMTRAAQYLNRSLLCDGSNALSWAHLGDVNLAGGNLHQAIANYEAAVRLKPDFADALHNLGVAWLRLEQWATAADFLREATLLKPGFAMAYNNWGLALRLGLRLAEAAERFEKAATLEPDNPHFAFNLAVTLHALGELDKAEAVYRNILSICPAHHESANNVATLLKEQGRFEESIQQFRDLLALQPDYAMAYYCLSEFAAVGRYQFTAAELERIETLMLSERAPAQDRCFCCFALASVRNKEAAYDEAFAYYKKANDLKLGLLRERNQAFDSRQHEAFIERIIATQDEKYFESIRGWGTPTDLPIFVVGMPRSGSTLVEQILASHPQVFGAGEIGDIPEYFVRWAVQTRPSPPLPADHRAALELAGAFLQAARRLGRGADRIVLKNLENYLYLGAIATLFPGARVIHCRRDPLDLCLSCYFQNFQHITFACSLEDIGVYHRSYEKLMAHWQRVLPLPVHEVRYEDLIDNQDVVTHQLLDFCGLHWDERCLTFFNTRRAVRTASSVQVRRPISSTAVGRWRNHRTHLQPLFAALGLSVPRPTPQPFAPPDQAIVQASAL